MRSPRIVNRAITLGGSAVGSGSTPDRASTPVAKLLKKWRRNFLQKAGRHARFGQIGAVAAAVHGTGHDQLIHGARHADVAKTPFFLNFFGNQHGPRMRKETFLEAAQKD